MEPFSSSTQEELKIKREEAFAKSRFRSGFKLNEKDINYIQQKGFPVIKEHAFDFIQKRLAPAFPVKDGKQTPYKGHPVFKAQHSTATCCRSCLSKWHGISKGKELNKVEIEYVVQTLMDWIEKQSNLNH